MCRKELNMKMTKKIITAGVLSLAMAVGTNMCIPIITGAESTEPTINDFNEDEFFVYTGKYGEKQLPLLEYYYPSEGISGTSYKHRKSYYIGELPEDLQYGDIFVTDDEIVTTLIESTRNTYELDKDTNLIDIGNCTDLMELRSLKVDNKTYNGSSMQPSYSVYTFNLSDETGREYYYSFDSFGSSLGKNISGAAEGTVFLFAVYNDSAIIPVDVPIEPEILKGDVNNDGEFSISDVVLLQKWLLAVPDTHLDNWRAADLCKDDRLDVFDLCLMKRLLLTTIGDNTDSSFDLQSVSDVQTNVDKHNEWQGYIAHSENEFNDIIQENEGVSVQDAGLEGAVSDCFDDKLMIVIYSPCNPSNQYSIIDDIVVAEEGIDISTTSKIPDMPKLTCCYRRYLYIVDK